MTAAVTACIWLVFTYGVAWGLAQGVDEVVNWWILSTRERDTARRCPSCDTRRGHPHFEVCHVARCLHDDAMVPSRTACTQDHNHGCDVWNGEVGAVDPEVYRTQQAAINTAKKAKTI